MEPVVNYVILSPDVQHVPKLKQNVRSVQVDIICQVEYVRSVQHQLPIVMFVHQEVCVRHVRIHIIQRIMEPVVLYVQVKDVLHVMHQVESVPHVQVDII